MSDNCHLRTTSVHRAATNRVRWLPCVSCLLRIGLIWLSLAGDVNSGTGGTVLFPMSNFPTRKPSGLQLEISSSWVECSGYRPIKFTVRCVPPAPADRTIRVNVTPNQWGQLRESVECEIDIPQGATSVVKEIPVSQTSFWNSLDVATYEDGDRLDDLCGSTAFPRSVNVYDFSEAYPTILLIDPDAPASQLAAMTANETYSLPNLLPLLQKVAPPDDFVRALDSSPGISDNAMIGCATRLASFHMEAPALLPTSSQCYSSVDLIIISADDLTALVDQHPRVWQAIRQSLVTGGNLIVFGMEGAATRRRELDRCLAIETGEVASPNDDSGGWILPADNSYASLLQPLIASDTVSISYAPRRAETAEEVFDEDANDETQGDERPLNLPEPQFMHRAMGLGRVVALDSAEPGSMAEDQWAWMLNDLDDARWRWYLRNGHSRIRDNLSFWEFLIPGVGAAPVLGFLTIITLFMIMIGPVNYILLDRIGRLYLLLVTVPLGAALVTLSLYGYALFKDGLGTRVRARSYSRLLPTGEMVTWSRQSYYSGLAPSAGLIYPANALVLPLDDQPRLRQSRRRVVSFGDKSQQWSTGYLTSRSVCQMLVTEVNSPQPPLRLSQPLANQPPRVENLSLPRIEQLLARNGEGVFWGERIAPGESAELVAITLEEARKRLLSLYNANQSGYPPGFSPPRRNAGRYVNYYGTNMDDTFSPPNFGTSRLEMEVQQIFASLKDGSSGLPAQYVAFTNVAPAHVSLGRKGVSEVSSFHVIQGDWPNAPTAAAP